MAETMFFFCAEDICIGKGVLIANKLRENKTTVSNQK